MSQAQEDIIEQPNTQPETPNTAVPQEEPLEIEVTDAEQEEKPQAKQEKSFDPKTDKVEFSTPEQQEKFNYIYKQTKMSDARNQMLTDLLQTQQKRLEELEGRFKSTDSAEAERMLMGKVKAARDAGDDLAEINAIKEMGEYFADKKISERAPRQQPQQQYQESAPDAQYVYGLMQEADSSGQPLRPYLNPDHPEFENSIEALENIKLKYIGDPYALPKTMADLDQMMRAKMTKQTPPNQFTPRPPSPMAGGNLTSNKQKTTIKMTRQELDIAKKLGVDPKRYAARRDEINGRK